MAEPEEESYEDRFREALTAILGDPNELTGRSKWTRYLYEAEFHAEVYETVSRQLRNSHG